MNYPKLLVQIGEQQFDITNQIIIEEDLSQIYNTLTFNIPAIDSGNFSTMNLEKYDVVKVYFKLFETLIAYESAQLSDLILIFDGYIDSLPLREDKESGLIYESIICKSTMGLVYERTTTTKSYSSNLITIFTEAFRQTDISTYMPIENIIVQGISDNLVISIPSTSVFGEVLDTIKEKYAIQIYQAKDKLYINTPFYFTQQSTTVYEFDLETNVFSINYGNISQNKNCIVVIGLGVLGIAFDPISYQLQNGVKQDDLVNSVVPNPLKLYPEYIYRRDIQDTETCQEIARNKLLEIAKNYGITIDTPYIPDMKIGDQFIIKNSKKISPTQIWTVKRRTITINKTDIKQTLVGYSNSISDFPKDILLAADGILDTDILNLGNKIPTTFTGV